MLQQVKLEDNHHDLSSHSDNITHLLHQLTQLKSQSKKVLVKQLSKYNINLPHDLRRVQELKNCMNYQDACLRTKLQSDVDQLERSFKNIMYYHSFLDEYSVSTFTPDVLSQTQPVPLKNEFVVKLEDKVNESLPRFINKSSQESCNNTKRGPYKKYSASLKQKALDLVELDFSNFQLSKGSTINEVCQLFQIPKKNLRRWIEIGAQRQKGGGRKLMDKEMEEQLHEWCMNQCLEKGRPVSRSQIRKKALEISKYPDKFKASKGWTDKFVKKYNLRKNEIRQVVEELQYVQAAGVTRNVLGVQDTQVARVAETEDEAIDKREGGRVETEAAVWVKFLQSLAETREGRGALLGE